MHRIEDLSLDAKRAVAAALHAERAGRRASFPLSSAQLRLWLIDRNVDGDSIYTVSRAFVLDGPLDTEALARSVDEIVRRHAILRTTYHLINDDPVQIVNAVQPFAFIGSDLRTIGPEQSAAAVAAIVAEEARHRFALDRDVMVRGRLVRLLDERHLLIFTLHHIAIDEWSLEIFFRELQTCYAAFSQGATPLLGPIGMTYADFAQWERRANEGERVAAQLAYWQTQLAGAPNEIALPVTGPRPAVPSVAGAADGLRLSNAGVTALAKIGRRAGATPFMTYVAAFAVMLHSVSGETDLVIGTPISGRRGADSEALIGFFANAVALRFDLTGDPTFAVCVDRAKQLALAAFDNGDVPFERVVTGTTNRRIPGANPLFNTAFAIERRAGSELQLANLTVAHRPHLHETAKFDMLALLSESAEGVDFRLHYRTDRFAASTITALLRRMCDIIDRASANPDLPLAQLLKDLPPLVRDESRDAPNSTPMALRGAERRPGAIESPHRDRLRTMVAELLNVQVLDDQADFFEHGGHSLLAVRLIARVEAELGLRLPMAAFVARPTVAGLADAVAAAEARQPVRSALEIVRRGSAGIPVVVFHGDYTGGGSYLRALAGELGDRTIYAIAPHGADGGSVPESIEAMAADRLALLQRENVRAPFDLVGYCNGAAVALEVARSVAASGAPPPRVFAIGSEPHEPAIVACAAMVRLVCAPFAVGERMQARIVLRLLRWKRRIRRAGPSALVAIVREEVRWRIDARRRAIALVTTASADAAEPSLLDAYSDRLIRYRPRPYPGSIFVFRPITGESGSRDSRPAGWARVSASARIEVVPGDHQSAITTFVRHLAHRLRGHLDR